MTFNTQSYKESIPALDPSLKVPQHIAIVMDGNGRWAKQHNLPLDQGHAAGAEALKKLLYAVEKWGIPYITVYALSTENLGRDEDEVSALMGLMKYHLEHSVDELIQAKARLNFIGDIDALDPLLQKKLKSAVKATKDNKAFTLTAALGYGSRRELLHVAKEIALKVQQNILALDDLTEDTFQSLLYTKNLPDPDLFIRPSGEYRLSNFLLWQSAYTELYFTPTLWPDFSHEDLLKAIESYNNRERRYGRRLV